MRKPTLQIVVLFALLGTEASAHDHNHSAHQHETMASTEAAVPSGSLYNSQSAWRKKDGSEAKINILAGKPKLVAMLYTSCQTACPMTIGEMKLIAAKLSPAERSKLDFAMLSFDNEKDTPQALTAFGKKMNLDTSWTLLSPKSPADSSEVAAALGVRYKKLPDGHYVHSNVIFLLNDRGEIVAKKDGLNSDPTRFVAEVKSLLKESK